MCKEKHRRPHDRTRAVPQLGLTSAGPLTPAPPRAPRVQLTCPDASPLPPPPPPPPPPAATAPPRAPPVRATGGVHTVFRLAALWLITAGDGRNWRA
ncbi:acrosin-like [Sciurus carolinensis]|uniref:acrosin-like n=1 Tax=Sciurus carolinensis TaxID=30640 RepID=UPI001FB1FF74|nr:acrosin-like [Sciurus carolinensis]